LGWFSNCEICFVKVLTAKKVLSLFLIIICVMSLLVNALNIKRQIHRVGLFYCFCMTIFWDGYVSTEGAPLLGTF
jgi:hypothetical protein